VIQATFGFATDSGQKTGAWDEVYYTNHTLASDAMTAWLSAPSVAVIFAGSSPLGHRLQCLSSQCYLYYGRFSDPDSKTTKSISYRPNGGQVLGYRGSDNMAQDAAAFQLLTNNGYKREVRLGGLPDSWSTGGVISQAQIDQYGAPVNSGRVAADATGNFIEAWAAIGGGIRYRSSTIGGPSSWKITGASKASQYTPVVVTVDLTNGPPDTTATYAMSCRGQPQMRGTWKIALVATGQYTLLGSERVSVPATFTGYLTQRLWTISAPVIMRGLFAAVHKLGKKKYQYAGRRSPILIRH
jgi:hypothetical protein